MVLVGNHTLVISELKLQNNLASFPEQRSFFDKKVFTSFFKRNHEFIKNIHFFKLYRFGIKFLD